MKHLYKPVRKVVFSEKQLRRAVAMATDTRIQNTPKGHALKSTVMRILSGEILTEK